MVSINEFYIFSQGKFQFVLRDEVFLKLAVYARFRHLSLGLGILFGHFSLLLVVNVSAQLYLSKLCYFGCFFVIFHTLFGNRVEMKYSGDGVFKNTHGTFLLLV